MTLNVRWNHSIRMHLSVCLPFFSSVFNSIEDIMCHSSLFTRTASSLFSASAWSRAKMALAKPWPYWPPTEIFIWLDPCRSETSTSWKSSKSADPSRRDMAISYAGSKRCQVRPHPNQNPKSKLQNPNSKLQNPKSKLQTPNSKIQTPKSKIQNPNSKLQNPNSKIQNPKSKIQTAPFGAATKRTKTKLIQNPKSKLQNPKSKIQNPKSKIQNPKSKIQNPRSKIQNPKSKIQNPKSKLQTPNSKLQTQKSKIQNPNSKIQNPNGPFGVWILDLVGPGPEGMAM